MVKVMPLCSCRSLSAQQIFMPFLKKEMEMAGAVVEVFMDAVIDRLQDFSGKALKQCYI